MNTDQDKKNAMAKLSEPQNNTIKGVIRDLEYFLDHNQEISNAGLKQLRNAQSSLNVFIDQYTNSIINLLKQGYDLD